jgi:LPS sulfotransferase NodH
LQNEKPRRSSAVHDNYSGAFCGQSGLAVIDADPDSVMPVKSYMICAIPRTGSYLLCDMLRATGVAGTPNEYFSDSYQKPWSARWGTSDYESYLRRIVELGTTPNGILGVKSHPWQFNHFARQAAGRGPVQFVERPAILERWFPDLHYVWLRRRDRLRQAISYARSLQTNIWWDADIEPVPNANPKPEALKFDFDLITQSVARLVEEEDMWRRYFAVNRIEPLVIYYEDLLVDAEGSVCSVLKMLQVEPTSGTKTNPGFRRQADDITASWVARYRAELARGPYEIWRGERSRTTARQARPASSVGSEAPTQKARTVKTPKIDLESALCSRRWLRCSSPFPHIRATDVFEQGTYAAMVAQYEALFKGDRFTRGIPGYDVTAYTVTSKTGGPLSLVASRGWHDMLARLFGVNATGEINVALHHHAVGSFSGAPHNDLNPGWFVERQTSDGIVVHDPTDGCDYRHGAGKGSADGDVASVERMRAIAVILYLANPTSGVVGGQTGLYRTNTDPIDNPAAVIPPLNNSLVAFECQPSSFHGFISNRTAVRNCLVMWLHRDKDEVIRRWGESSIVYWRR